MSEDHQSISELDLEPIMVKVMDKDEGYGWSLEFTRQVTNEYKRYLILCLENPDFPMVPSTFVDEFWHFHILDTQKYAEDCNHVFGYFLHHFPYFGMRGKEDEENLKKAWTESCVLYEKRFGSIDKVLWPASKRCPNCGRRSHQYFKEERPRLKLAA
ncbi:MAG: hypothetical protein Q8O37_13155 [Sulfuricellaceae bacterium]|nr:hypothetical protein [Sulfuricellaceae bacterium]